MVVATLIILLCSNLPAHANANSNPNSKELIKYSMRGENVKIVQKLLSEAGFYNGDIDGIFGNETLNAVKAYQFSKGLLVDGVVGEETLKFLKRSDNKTDRKMRSIVMHASAYSAFDPGNGKYTGNGTLLKKGIAAVDPNVIPLGTRLFIPGYGEAIADDVGGSIKGNRIDLAFDSRDDALQFGVRNVIVYIVE